MIIITIIITISLYLKLKNTVIAGVSEEDEHPKPTKSSICHAQYKASDNQAQLLVFSWRKCLELTGKRVKSEFLVPSNNQCSMQVGLASFGQQPSYEKENSDHKPGQVRLFIALKGNSSSGGYKNT